jgi:hypothetical protein
VKKTFIALFAAISTLACGTSNDQLQLQLDKSRAENASLRQRVEAREALAAATKDAPASAEAPSQPVAPPAPAPAATGESLIATPAPTALPRQALYAFAPGGTVGQSVGYLNRDPMDGRPCGGMCWWVKNHSPYYAAIYVDGRRLTVYSGLEPVLMQANEAKPGGGRRAAPVTVVPPGALLKFVTDSPGQHTIRAILYTLPPGQMFLQPVGVWENTETFPYRQDKVGVLSQMYGSQFDISKY